MKIFVGSTNPVKINSVTLAASETWPEVVVQGLEVPSGIPDQPYGDEQTKEGAINRAKRVLERGAIEAKNQSTEVLGMGLEGGVFDYQGELWSTVWVAVTDVQDNLFLVNGARFQVPEPLASAIKNGGEMGPAMDKIIGDENVKHKGGAIGVITQDFIDRTEEYSGLAKLALGLWYGRDWDKAK